MKKEEIEFVTPKIAKDLKELGYDGECCAIFRSGRLFHIMGFEKVNSIKQSVIAAPLWQQAVEWLRTEKKINVEANYLPNIQTYRSLFKPMNILAKDYKSMREYKNACDKYYGKVNHNTSYKALEEGIEKAIEILKSEKGNEISK